MDVTNSTRSCWPAPRCCWWRSIAVRLSGRLGLPSLLIYLGMGLLLGESGLGAIHFEDAAARARARVRRAGDHPDRGRSDHPVERGPPGDAARASSWPRSGWRSASAWSPVSRTSCSALDWQIAVLLGAVTSPTDAAAVFSVLRRVPIRPRLRGAAGGRVRSERRADRPAGHSGQHGRHRRSTACRTSPGW